MNNISEHITLLKSPCVHQYGSSTNPVLLGFYGEKTSTSASLTMIKPLTVWITTNFGKFLKRWEYQNLTCLLRNLCAGQKATVRTGHGTTDGFQIWKGVCQGCILAPCLFIFLFLFFLCLFNLNAEYIM